MRYGSGCSGIESASVAAHVLGWSPAWFAENDKTCSRLLARRFPQVDNHGDFNALPGLIERGEIEAPDVFVAGTPCQAFSVAGLRKGMNDARGKLTMTYIKVVDAIDEKRGQGDECVAVWENVPGVLNHKENPFGCFLGALAGEDVPLRPPGGRWTNAGVVVGPKRSIAWRVIDAQYFGLAQRRRRVFVVASARDDFDPAAVFLEFQGVRRDTPPSREAKQGVAGTLDARIDGGGRGVERTGNPRGQDAVVAVGPRWPAEIASTLNAHFGEKQGLEDQHVNSGCPLFVPVICFSSKAYGADTMSHCSPTLRAGMPAGSHPNAGIPPAIAYGFQPRIARNGRGDMGDVVNALTAQAGETGKGDAAPCVAVIHADAIGRTGTAATPSPDAEGRMRLRDAGTGIIDDGSTYALTTGQPHAVCVTGVVTHTLKAEGFDASEDGTGRGQPIVPAYSIARDALDRSGEASDGSAANRSGLGVDVDVAATLKGKGPGAVANQMQVRRLMPVECERLQGFPDGWTEGQADGPRYKQLGNSKAVPCIRWVFQRIQRELGVEGAIERAIRART